MNAHGGLSSLSSTSERAVDERVTFQQHAVQMAHRQADWLLGGTVHLPSEMLVAHAVQLINDCVRYLDLPALAAKVALGFHPAAERWAAWGPWAMALDALLNKDEHAYPLPDRIRLLHCRSHAAYELGDLVTATRTAMTALQLAEGHATPDLIAWSLNKLGLAAYHQEQLPIAQTHWERAYDLGQTCLPPLQLGHLCMNLGLVAVAQGQFEEAHRRFDHAHHYYHAENDLLHLAKLQCNIADLQRREGVLSDAPATLRAARDTFHALGARYDCGLAENDLGCVYLALEQFDQALEAFHAAMHTFDTIGSLNGKALVLSNVAELYVTTAAWEQAEMLLREAHDLAVVCDKPVLVAAVDVDRGRMLAARGESEAARQTWERALAVQQAQGAWHAAQYTQRLIDTLSDGVLTVGR